MNLQGSIIGLAGQGAFGNLTNFLPDTPRRAKPGLIIPYADTYWGGGEIQLVKAGATIAAWQCVTLIPTLNTNIAFLDDPSNANKTAWEITANPVPVTANLGQPVGISMSAMTVGQYGWVFISATACPHANSIAAVTGPMFISATAGQLFTTATAGRQILNFRSVQTGSATVVKAIVTGFNQGFPGGFTIPLTNLDGIFVGGTCSGTGVGVNALVTSVNSDGRTIVVSVANTATALSGNLTFTQNAAGAAPFLPIGTFQRPFAQGQIT